MKVVADKGFLLGSSNFFGVDANLLMIWFEEAEILHKVKFESSDFFASVPQFGGRPPIYYVVL